MGQSFSKHIQTALDVIFASSLDVTNFEEVHRRLLGTDCTKDYIFVKMCKKTALNKNVGMFRKIDEIVKPGLKLWLLKVILKILIK